jgi:hypothetical protein
MPHDLAPFVRFADFIGVTKNRPPANVKSHRGFDFLDIAPAPVKRGTLGISVRHQNGIGRAGNAVGA